MGTPVYAGSLAELGLDGWAVWSPDDGNGTQYQFPYMSTNETKTSNVSVIPLADNTQNPHVAIAGARIGTRTMRCILNASASWAGFLTAIVGPRNSTGVNAGNLTPWLATFKPGANSAAYSQSRIWIRRVKIDSGWAVQGLGNLIVVNIEAIVLDPDNNGTIENFTAATTATTGTQVSAFLQMTLQNITGGSPTVYDGFNRFVFSWDNSMAIINAPDPALGAFNTPAGCVAGSPVASLQVFQVRNATNPIPRASGFYPLTLLIPTADKTHKLTAAFAVAYVSDAEPIDLRGAIIDSATYRLVGGQSGNGTESWPCVISYA